ncbi:UDP-N-acetylmuramate--L-alanine ligase [Peptococcaceae bacterium 1198_IL3148]
MIDIPNNIHFIGIGGAGMSGIARILVGLGYKVTGSDIKESAVTEKLTDIGIKCFIGHRKENVANAQMVVVSTAIPPQNPELVQAKQQNIPIVHRGEMLAKLMARQKGIAVAGSHGKTTTTSMMSLVLEKAGYDPTIVIGGELNDIGGNAKLGHGDYLVAEADESDGSFLLLEPNMVVLTNIEDDHLDHYGSVDKIFEAFKSFVNKINSGGLAVLCYDDPNIRKLLPEITAPTVTYGTAVEADYTIRNMALNGKANSADVYKGDQYIGRLELAVPGRHNLLNALAVVAMSLHIGLDFPAVAEILWHFRGVHRRYQLLGEVNDIKVVDDYAHHPTEIKATLQGARQTNPARIISIFQPHRYTRTKQLHEQFGAALTGADIVIINDIYSAGESPIDGVTAQLIVNAARRNNIAQVVYIEDLKNVAPYVAGIAQRGDLILTMGAGNVWTAGVELVKELKERF